MSYFNLILPNIIILVMILGFLKGKKQGINNAFGYRSKKSMENEKMWNLANSFAANFSIIAMVICILLTFIVSILKLNYMILMIYSAAVIFLSILLTEIYIRKVNIK